MNNKRVDIELKPYCCGFCGISFGATVDLETHVEKHLLQQEEKVQENPILEKESENVTREVKELICCICKQAFTQEKELKLHLESHAGVSPYACHICNNEFSDPVKFISHLIYVHGDGSLEKCSTCDYLFTNKGLLIIHTLTHDEGENPSTEIFEENGDVTLEISLSNGANENQMWCRVCGRILPNDKEMKKHMKIHQHILAEKNFECTECEKKYVSDKKLKLHMRIHTPGKFYDCETCQKSFTVKSDLKKHMMIVHEKLRPFSCNICDKTYSYRTNLIDHINSHKGELPFKCTKCGMQFRQGHHLKRHLLIHDKKHSSEKCVCMCRNCGRQYTNKKFLYLHESVCLNGNVEENKSDQTENYENKDKRVGFKTFVCCGSTFLDAPTYMLHLQSHPPESFHICSECGRRFLNAEKFQHHLEMHKMRKGDITQCEECGKIFKSKTNLSYHRMRKHSNGEGMFKCKECDKKYVTLADLNFHMAVHTGEKRYACTYCSKVFRLASVLKKHVDIHKGVKMFKCDFCEKSFSQSGHLANHRRLHTGEKPFVCEICTRAFTQKYDMVKHTRIHTGETPYLCQHCGRKFNQKNSLRKHMMQHPEVSPKL